MSKYFAKGRLAVVDGRLQVRDWEDSDGAKRRSVEIVADHIYFCDSKRDNEAGAAAPVVPETRPDFIDVDTTDVDLPF